MITFNIVGGIPASGKSTYINSHKCENDVVLDNYKYQKLNYNIQQAYYLTFADVETIVHYAKGKDITIWLENCYYKSFRRKQILHFIAEVCDHYNVKKEINLFFINIPLEKYIENHLNRFANADVTEARKRYESEMAYVEDPAKYDLDSGFNKIVII